MQQPYDAKTYIIHNSGSMNRVPCKEKCVKRYTMCKCGCNEESYWSVGDINFIDKTGGIFFDIFPIVKCSDCNLRIIKSTSHKCSDCKRFFCNDVLFLSIQKKWFWRETRTLRCSDCLSIGPISLK